MSEPIHIISLGAGVQSSTMALMAAKGEIKPMPVAAIFADTQDEPQSVYKWLGWLAPKLPFPVLIVTRGRLSDAVLKTTGGITNIPAFTLENGEQGKLMRTCTADYKLNVIRKKERELAGIKRMADGIRVIRWIGISTDEAIRMKDSRDSWAVNRYPLAEELRVSRHDCILWMERNGYPKPPRSACSYCPLHGNAEWRRLRDEEPTEFAKAVAFEKRLQAVKATMPKFRSVPFLHRSLVPLDAVDFSTDVERGQSLLGGFKAECEGMCGV